jgi:hypothetical protein
MRIGEGVDGCAALWEGAAGGGHPEEGNDMRHLRFGVGLAACLLVGTLLSAASSAGSPARHAAPGPPASPGATVAVAGGCTTATATTIAKKLHLGNADFTSVPVTKLVCGAFLGPGSEAAAFALTIPSCGISGDWVVFRRQGGSWLYVFESGDGVVGLQAVGRDIKETQNVLRPSDPHCFPTGGSRSQVWHWNGTRFVGSGWKYSKPQTPKPQPNPRVLRHAAFFTPSHNLSCEIWDGGPVSPHVYCQSVHSPHTVEMSPSGALTIGANPGNYDQGTKLQLLPYGKSLRVGRFLCTSEQSGVICIVNALGRGFLIDRDHVQRVGH